MRAYDQVNFKKIWNKKLQIGIKYMVEIRLKILDNLSSSSSCFKFAKKLSRKKEKTLPL